MTKIPKLPVMIGTTILFLLSGVFRMASIAANPETGKPRLAQLLLFLAALLVMYVYYKAWAAIQDGHARTTSGKAVGYSFIPLFNLYWIFVVMVGFAGDFNAYLQRHEIDRKPLSGPLFWVIGFAWIFAFFMIKNRVLGALGVILLIATQVYAVHRLAGAVDELPRFEPEIVPAVEAATEQAETPEA